MRAMLRRLIREDVEIVLALRPELAPVKADRGQIEQIVLNLSVNARDAMPKGGTLTIRIDNVELDDRYAKTHVAVTPGAMVIAGSLLRSIGSPSGIAIGTVTRGRSRVRPVILWASMTC